MMTVSDQLRREYFDFGQRPRGFCNPDGPVAADTIDALVAALEECLHELDARGCSATYEPVKSGLAALALARGGK